MSSHLSTTFRHQVTWNGFSADVIKSGLQKYIRRNQTEQALYCVGELDLFKMAETGGEGIRTNLFHRLLIIYMEDVGNLSILEDVARYVEELEAERRDPARSYEREERLLSEWVILMSHSSKARTCSHVRAMFHPKYVSHKALTDVYPSLHPYWSEIQKNIQEHPAQNLSYLCEMFLRYLKERNLLAVYYGFAIAQSREKLEKKIMKSAKPIWFLFHSIRPMAPSMVDIFMGWFKEHMDGMKEEEYRCWLIPLLHVIGVLPMGERPVYDAAPYGWDRNRAGEIMELDDFVKDRHTKEGRGKSLVEFALEGAQVVHEAPYVNALWKRFYEDGKRVEEYMAPLGEHGPRRIKRPTRIVEEPCAAVAEVTASAAASSAAAASAGAAAASETEAYHFMMRTQLTTMNGKQDVYFATDAVTQQCVVVKGPFVHQSHVDAFLSHQEWKKKHDLPCIPYVVRSLLPDRWPEGVPLGIRNQVDRSVPHLFLVFDSVIAPHTWVTKTHSSKKWPETEVMDWDAVGLHFDLSRSLTTQEMTDYVHAILYRYVLGISDFADRNFLMLKGRVVSIDEDVKDKTVHLYQELRKNKAERVCQWLQTNEEHLRVHTWTRSLAHDEAHVRRLEEVQDGARRLRLFQADL